jgi:hypothetical protein
MNIARFTVIVVAGMNLADAAQVVGERLVAILSVEISELGIDVELQQERHLGVPGVSQMTMPSR